MVYIAALLQRGSKRWHHDIDKQVQGNGEEYELKDFNSWRQPWRRMRQATNRYLAKKGPKSVKRCDELLRKLVLEHERKHIAIVACGHAFSPEALEDLLTPGTLAHVGSPESLVDYLQCVHAISLVSETVSKEEGLEALRILELKDIADSSYLEEFAYSLADASSPAFVKMRMYAVPMVSASFLYESNFAMKVLLNPRAVKLLMLPCGLLADAFQQLENLSRELANCRLSRDWAQAYKTSAWLSKFDQADHFLPKDSQDFLPDFRRLLVHALPSWHAWARWKPNIIRLETWGKLSPNSRQQFGQILDLDGPDFYLNLETRGKSLTPSTPSYDDGLRMGGSTPGKCRDMAESTMRLLEKVVTYRPEDGALFMCTMAGPVIPKQKLELMELLMSDGYAVTSVCIPHFLGVGQFSCRHHLLTHIRSR